MSLRSCLAAAALLALACAAPRSSGGIDVVDEARRFQAEYERALRADDHSFLTTVAAYYLAPGERLALVLVDGAWIEGEGGVQFEHTDAGVSVNEQLVTDHALLPADEHGRFAFAISHQEHDFRVLIHDREAELRASFSGIEWFAIEPALIVDARFEARATRDPQSLQTSRGLSKTLWIAGEASFELDGQTLRLLVFGYAPEPTPGEPLLIPFRDQTSGHESYAAGRYLELELPPEQDQLRLDFNRATNPLCAYSEHYNCPMPPRFNSLPIAIRAGAKAPSAHSTSVRAGAGR
jgi:uncharacterized protein